jgi:hypothetical protein
MLIENTQDVRCRPLWQKDSVHNAALRIQLEVTPSPWLGALLLGDGLGSEKALGDSGGRDAKAPMISEEPYNNGTMATTTSYSNSLSNSLAEASLGQGSISRMQEGDKDGVKLSVW